MPLERPRPNDRLLMLSLPATKRYVQLTRINVIFRLSFLSKSSSGKEIWTLQHLVKLPLIQIILVGTASYSALKTKLSTGGNRVFSEYTKLAIDFFLLGPYSINMLTQSFSFKIEKKLSVLTNDLLILNTELLVSDQLGKRSLNG